MPTLIRSKTEVANYILEFMQNNGMDSDTKNSLDPETDLYELGILDSYDLVDLITNLEEFTGKPYVELQDTDRQSQDFSINFLTAYFSEQSSTRPE